MILQALSNYYEVLAQKGILARPGWSPIKISYGLNLAADGSLLEVQTLTESVTRGKKAVDIPREFSLPASVKRSVAIAPNFLWDNSSYLLGASAKGERGRIRECFAACAQHHHMLLDGCEDAAAKAILLFFDRWDPDAAASNALLEPYWDAITAGCNLMFLVEDEEVCGNPAIQHAWQENYDDTESCIKAPCLVTGNIEPVAILHPAIKGVRGAQPMGASLVSFNGDAFESRGREQGMNAPVGRYAAFAYGAALNYLINTRDAAGHPRFTTLIGDTTVVFWAEDAGTAYADFAALAMNGTDSGAEDAIIKNATLRAAMQKLARGEDAEWDTVPLHPANSFYVLGLAPNASRLSVRFFLRNSFGSFIGNLEEHYRRLEIWRPADDKWQTLPPWRMLSETVPPHSREKSPQPQMAGDTLRAILTGGNYPATLLSGIYLRIRAEREVNANRAAILKAYYLRRYYHEGSPEPDLQNTKPPIPKEVLTMSLNEASRDIPYLLGRLFSVLEQVQQAANFGITTTIKDKYFSTAASIPATIFPLLIRLSNSHLRKLPKGHSIYFEKQITELCSHLPEELPAHLSVPQQGSFYLGYFHQTQKRYEKKNTEEKTNV